MPKTDVRKVAPSSSISHPNGVVAISADDAVLIGEFLCYAVESIDAVITLEERCGNRAPILQTLRAYAADARSLLDRLA